MQTLGLLVLLTAWVVTGCGSEDSTYEQQVEKLKTAASATGVPTRRELARRCCEGVPGQAYRACATRAWDGYRLDGFCRNPGSGKSYRLERPATAPRPRREPAL